MAKKKTDEVKPQEPIEPIQETEKVELPIEGDEQVETKEEEVVVSKSLAGVETKEKVKLKSTKVFEAMTGTFRTVWVKE